MSEFSKELVNGMTQPPWMKPVAPPPSWALPLLQPDLPPPKPPQRSAIVRQAERALKLTIRRLAKRGNVAARRKRPPKALAEARANLGRLEALIGKLD